MGDEWCVLGVEERWGQDEQGGDRKNKDIKGFKDIKDFKEFLGRHIHTTESAYRPRDVLVTPNT